MMTMAAHLTTREQVIAERQARQAEFERPAQPISLAAEQQQIALNFS